MLASGLHAIRRLILAAMLIHLGVTAGCQRYDSAQNAPGAATIEELVELYEAAHKEQSVEKLRDICFWEAQSRGRHREDLEKPMIDLFEIRLEKAEYVEGPPPDPVRGGSANYVRQRPGQEPQENGMIGPVYGKLALIGSVGGGDTERYVKADPAYIVMKFRERYYIDVLLPVVVDAVTSVRTGQPSRSQPLPLGAEFPN